MVEIIIGLLSGIILVLFFTKKKGVSPAQTKEIDRQLTDIAISKEKLVEALKNLDEKIKDKTPEEIEEYWKDENNNSNNT